MCDPRNNNPFTVDDTRITNERDANRALSDTANNTLDRNADRALLNPPTLSNEQLLDIMGLNS